MFCTGVIDWSAGEWGEADCLGAGDNRGCREAWKR